MKTEEEIKAMLSDLEKDRSYVIILKKATFPISNAVNSDLNVILRIYNSQIELLREILGLPKNDMPF